MTTSSDDPPPGDQPSGDPPPGDPPPCVVLVDDNPTLLDQLAELLGEFGVQVAAAVDRGELAVGAIAAAQADDLLVNVVVMDVRMPGIGGLEATRQVKAAYPNVQVLLHTAFAGHLEELAGQVGAFAEIPKGIGITELVDVIWHASQSPPVPTPAASPPRGS